MEEYLAKPLPFPTHFPEGFEPLPNEPEFDEAVHLQIEMPKRIYTLEDFGYSEQDVNACPTPFAATSVFRILSDKGAAALLEVAELLEEFTTSNARIARNVRGGAYRSKFLRDLCLSPKVTQAMSEICGIPLLPHTIPHQLGHLNYNPEVVGENVDKWHVDTLRIDYVMFVTDPKSVQGGEFEYYQGTKEEFLSRSKAGAALDASKVISPSMPGPGYAILQQGNMVVHRAKGLTAEGKRITMVNGYVPQNIRFPDFCRFDQLSLVDPDHVAGAEYLRHCQWMAKEKLNAALTDTQFHNNTHLMADNLTELAQSLEQVAEQLRAAGQAEMEHFGDT